MVPRASNAGKPARVIHHVPGRLRIKVSGATGDLAFFRALEQFIGTVSGVARVRADPLSSSVVIDYAPADTLLPQRLLGEHSLNQWLHLKQAGRPERDPVDDGLRYLERHSRLAESIVNTAQRADATLRQASYGYLDLKMLLPLGLLAASSLHRTHGRSTPMWVTLSTMAFNTFMTLHRHRIDAPLIQIISRTVRRA